MDRDLMRAVLIETINDAPFGRDWDGESAPAIADALLDGPLARLVDIAEKAEALTDAAYKASDWQIPWSVAEPLLALRAVLGSPESLSADGGK